MSLPRKGSRRVEVDGTEYLWHIRRKPTHFQADFAGPMNLAVQALSEGPRRVLVVRLGISRPDNWIVPHQTGITTAMVREMIRRALRAGWKPLGAGPPFLFKYPVVKDTIGTIFPEA
ncbi:hypothetical protein JYK02_26540 [Corallococcus macrosporus]|uniref:Uncharacterized protein n=1 Tax=Corallococcus macrosporus TaxID=35 RepID=A0ABS3DID3_9BACT|nr:hypothetical protein [Corallococcus macrosporus]MBN8231084.1 hypothetical protein [Corallococcus macrosporus]